MEHDGQRFAVFHVSLSMLSASSNSETKAYIASNVALLTVTRRLEKQRIRDSLSDSALGKVREYQNLVFKILGFSRKEIIFSSLIEFMIIFISVIMIAIFFAVIGSKFIIENIFELSWKFNLEVLIYLGLSIGFVTLVLILLTNIKYLNPKVYPLIRNQ